MRWTALIILAVLAGACQPAFINGVPNEDSPYFEVPIDSRFMLQRTVTVLAREDRAYFQDGKALSWQRVNIYGDYCVLQVNARREVAQTITPDEFAVRKVASEQRFYLGRESPPRTRLQLAARGSIRVSDFEDTDEASTYRVWATIMQLHSPRHPDVVRMSCTAWGTPQGLPYLTVHKIRQALGDIFRLELFKPNR